MNFSERVLEIAQHSENAKKRREEVMKKLVKTDDGIIGRKT